MVLVGANGTGKSNFVVALELYLELIKSLWEGPEADLIDYEQVVRRGSSHGTPQIEFFAKASGQINFPGESESVELRAGIRMTFKGLIHKPSSLNTSLEISISDQSRGSMKLRWVDTSGREIFPGKGKYLERLAEMSEETRRLFNTLPSSSQGVDNFYLERRFYSSFFPYSNRYRFDLQSLRNEFGPTPSSIHGFFDSHGLGLSLAVRRLQTESPEVLKNVTVALGTIYPQISEIKAEPLAAGRVALFFRLKGVKTLLGESSVSDGMMHAIALLIAIESSSPDSILVIEEPENALHPWAVHEIMNLIQDKLSERSQPIIITTHSPVVVNAIRDPASLYIVENDLTRGTTITPAVERDTALSQILNDSGERLGEVWMGGGLGGIPSPLP